MRKRSVAAARTRRSAFSGRPLSHHHRPLSVRSRLLRMEPLEPRMLLSLVQGPAIVVNTITDGTDSLGSGVVSLRDAIAMADSSSTPTTITFDPTVFATAQTIVLTGGQLELSNTNEPTTIIGPAAGVTISGNNASRVLQVDCNVTAAISGAVITNGIQRGAAGGGGIRQFWHPDAYQRHDLEQLCQPTLAAESTSRGVGKPHHGRLYHRGQLVEVWGGGLFNDQHAVLTNVTVFGNSCTAGGGVLGNLPSGNHYGADQC